MSLESPLLALWVMMEIIILSCLTTIGCMIKDRLTKKKWPPS